MSMLEVHKSTKGDRDTWYLLVATSAKALEVGQPPVPRSLVHVVELQWLVKSTISTKASLFHLPLLVCHDVQVVWEVIPDGLVLVVDEDLVDGVNRPLGFHVTSRELNVLLGQTRLNPGAPDFQHRAPTLYGTRFLQRNHFFIAEVLMLDDLNHNFAKSVPLLDAGSFASYDALDQDLPDDSWIYLDTNAKGIGQTTPHRRLARTRHGYFPQALCLLRLYGRSRSHELQKN